MFKFLVVLAIVATVLAVSPRPTGEEYRADLLAAGLSTQAVDGILKISGDAYTNFSKYGKNPDFQDAIEAVTKLIFDLEKFMKTQSKEDQTAYQAYVEKKKEEYEN